MLIPFLVSKIHRAKITGTDLNYYGSISIDEELMEQANLRENQQVDVYNITNGNRLTTYVIPAPRGSGEMVLNGAAAHLVSRGDVVIVAAYAYIDEREFDSRNTVVLLMDDNNRVSQKVHGKI